MMKTRVSFVAVLVLLVSASALAQHKQYGELLEDYRGVQSYSRGPALVGTGSGDLEYQCVALTREFSNKRHGVAPDGFGSVTCAADMWNRLPQDYGYAAYPNGSTTKPQEGDLIVWWDVGWSGCNDESGYGHVGVHSGEKGVMFHNCTYH
jgi:hypothetical protein